MKKLITTLLICTMCFGLVSCSGVSYEDANTEQEDRFNGYFTTLKAWENGSGNVCYILYANDTGVMYFYFDLAYGKGITPLYNADGTLQVYEGFDLVEEE